jgi:hypothetical protein
MNSGYVKFIYLYPIHPDTSAYESQSAKAKLRSKIRTELSTKPISASHGRSLMAPLMEPLKATNDKLHNMCLVQSVTTNVTKVDDRGASL